MFSQYAFTVDRIYRVPVQTIAKACFQYKVHRNLPCDYSHSAHAETKYLEIASKFVFSSQCKVSRTYQFSF